MLADYPHLRLGLYVGSFIASVVLGVAALVAAVWDVRLGAALTAAGALIGAVSNSISSTNVAGLTVGTASTVRGMSIDLPQTADPVSGSSKATGVDTPA